MTKEELIYQYNHLRLSKYQGESNRAQINETNILDFNNLLLSMYFSNSNLADQSDIIRSSISRADSSRYIKSEPRISKETEPCDEGDYTIFGNGNDLGYGAVSYNYNQCEIDGVKLHGDGAMYLSQEGKLTMFYNNLSIISDGVDEVWFGYGAEGATDTLTVIDNFHGNTYMLESWYSSESSDGFTQFQGIIYHKNHGYAFATSNNLKKNEEFSFFERGFININSKSDQSASIGFDNEDINFELLELGMKKSASLPQNDWQNYNGPDLEFKYLWAPRQIPLIDYFGFNKPEGYSVLDEITVDSQISNILPDDVISFVWKINGENVIDVASNNLAAGMARGGDVVTVYLEVTDGPRKYKTEGITTKVIDSPAIIISSNEKEELIAGQLFENQLTLIDDDNFGPTTNGLSLISGPKGMTLLDGKISWVVPKELPFDYMTYTYKVAGPSLVEGKSFYLKIENIVKNKKTMIRSVPWLYASSPIIGNFDEDETVEAIFVNGVDSIISYEFVGGDYRKDWEMKNLLGNDLELVKVFSIEGINAQHSSLMIVTEHAIHFSESRNLDIVKVFSSESKIVNVIDLGERNIGVLTIDGLISFNYLSQEINWYQDILPNTKSLLLENGQLSTNNGLTVDVKTGIVLNVNIDDTYLGRTLVVDGIEYHFGLSSKNIYLFNPIDKTFAFKNNFSSDICFSRVSDVDNNDVFELTVSYCNSNDIFVYNISITGLELVKTYPITRHFNIITLADIDGDQELELLFYSQGQLASYDFNVNPDAIDIKTTWAGNKYENLTNFRVAGNIFENNENITLGFGAYTGISGYEVFLFKVDDSGDVEYVKTEFTSPLTKKMLVIDYDGDGIYEIATFASRGSTSMELVLIDIETGVAKWNSITNSNEDSLGTFEFVDINNDEVDEVILGVRGGIYVEDIKNEKLLGEFKYDNPDIHTIGLNYIGTESNYIAVSNSNGIFMLNDVMVVQIENNISCRVYTKVNDDSYLCAEKDIYNDATIMHRFDQNFQEIDRYQVSGLVEKIVPLTDEISLFKNYVRESPSLNPQISTNGIQYFNHIKGELIWAWHYSSIYSLFVDSFDLENISVSGTNSAYINQ